MSFLNTVDYVFAIPLLSILLLLAGIIVAIFMHPERFKNTRMAVFISIMGSMAVVVLAFNVILTTINLQTQNTINKAKFTKQAIDELWLFPNQLLKDTQHARREFLASLYYNNKVLYDITKGHKTVPTVKSELEEQYIALVLIQSWEDYLTLKNWDNTGDEVWLHNFLQWAQSPYLKAVYDNLKYNFADTTIELGDLLFEYAEELPIPTINPEVYILTIKKLLKDPRLQKIFKKTARKS